MKSILSISSIEPGPQPPPNRAEYPALSANAALVLIGVACSLLDRQIAAQAEAFKTEGGFTERLYRTRTNFRDKKI